MIEIEQQLAERGIAPDDITFIVDLIEERNAGEARSQAARLVALIFGRVERDSPAGCALRRALGFSGGASFARAAADFCVTKQYLEGLQSELETLLGPLAFVARAARVPVDPTPVAGPPGD